MKNKIVCNAKVMIQLYPEEKISKEDKARIVLYLEQKINEGSFMDIRHVLHNIPRLCDYKISGHNDFGNIRIHLDVDDWGEE